VVSLPANLPCISRGRDVEEAQIVHTDSRGDGSLHPVRTSSLRPCLASCAGTRGDLHAALLASPYRTSQSRHTPSIPIS